jgi:hypothetical protein
MTQAFLQRCSETRWAFFAACANLLAGGVAILARRAFAMWELCVRWILAPGRVRKVAIARNGRTIVVADVRNYDLGARFSDVAASIQQDVASRLPDPSSFVLAVADAFNFAADNVPRVASTGLGAWRTTRRPSHLRQQPRGGSDSLLLWWNFSNQIGRGVGVPRGRAPSSIGSLCRAHLGALGSPTALTPRSGELPGGGDKAWATARRPASRGRFVRRYRGSRAQYCSGLLAAERSGRVFSS